MLHSWNILKCLPFLHTLSLIGCYSIGEMPSLLLLDGHHLVSILFSLDISHHICSKILHTFIGTRTGR